MSETDSNRWIVVTGASSGIGAETSKMLLASGYSVVAAARRESELEMLYGDEQNALVMPWDLSDRSSIGDFAKATRDRIGPIRGLVHCAGMERTLPVHMTKISKIEDVFALNTYAAMCLVGAFSRKGMATVAASFILISSLAAHEGAPGKSIYAASKSALEGFACAAAAELSERGIRINCVAPGVVETRMVSGFIEQLTDGQRSALLDGYPFGIGRPEDVASFITYLVSDKARWLTGQTFILDGGHLTRA
ncbi:MAG: SDR family oxidoreductase [Clostridiales Family XIII bacterium]|jgi:NAD(P)-dependent dehydrogenase (short-subunit alcohol dehydrogenase family)|nr:SDR family oxidoreductase [Clostridiales Family XIII bacterium]